MSQWYTPSMHESLPIYLLVFAGLQLLGVYVMKRGEPLVSRTRALKIATNESREFLLFILQHFWPLHLITVSLLSLVLALLIENWASGSLLGITMLCMSGAVLTIFDGMLAAVPSYVVARHWKRQAWLKREERRNVGPLGLGGNEASYGAVRMIVAAAGGLTVGLVIANFLRWHMRREPTEGQRPAFYSFLPQAPDQAPDRSANPAGASERGQQKP